MKTAAALAALVLVSAGPAVRFEADGVRMGDALVQGATLQLRDAGGTFLLVSGSIVEPLAAELEVEAAPSRTLILEPGIRAQKKGDEILLSTHGKRRILLGDVALDAPVTLKPTVEGWMAGEVALGAAALRVRLQGQDPDTNLDSLREAARKIQQGREGRPEIRRAVQKRVRPRVRRVFSEDPFISAEVVDSPTLRFLPLISPAGF